MNSKEILKNLQSRIEFTNEVTTGLARFFLDFEKSPQGRNYHMDGPTDPNDKITHAHGGLDIVSRTPLDGDIHTVAITASAHGRVEIVATIGDEPSFEETIGFDPEMDTPADVAAKAVAAVMTAPMHMLADDLELYVSGPTEKMSSEFSLER